MLSTHGGFHAGRTLGQKSDDHPGQNVTGPGAEVHKEGEMVLHGRVLANEDIGRTGMKLRDRIG